MAVKANGQLYLTAEEQYERYRITCSAGDTIALGADGTAKAQVVLGFYRLGTDGVMEAFAPERLVYEVRAADDSVLYDDMIAPGGVTYDVTGDMRGDMASLYAEMRTADGSVLAVQSFGVVRDGADGEPGKPGDAGADGVTWDVRLSCGEAVYATAYAELKADVWAELTKDGAVTEMFALKVDWQDGNGTSIDSTTMSGGDGLTRYGLSNLFEGCVEDGVAPARLVLTAYARNAASGRPVAVLEKTFAVAYDTPRPIGRGGWEAGATYRNGEMVMVGDVVYMWNYPVSGNSGVSPDEDVKQNPEATHWLARQEEVLLATKVLLASFALVGGAVFMGDYVISRYGTSGGVASEDYTTFDEDDPDDSDGSGSFAPTLWMNFATGEINLGAGRVAGFKIGRNGLTNEGYDNDAYIILRNDAKGVFAGMGVNVASATLNGTITARLENNEARQTSATNTALYLSASGARGNYAFRGKGNGVLEGMVCGWKVQLLSADGNPVIDYSKGSYVLATHGVASDDDAFRLPTLSGMRNALAAESGPFAAELTIVNEAFDSGGGSIRVVGRKGITGQSTEYPMLYNGSGTETEDVTLQTGCGVKILLTFSGLLYQAYVVGRS